MAEGLTPLPSAKADQARKTRPFLTVHKGPSPHPSRAKFAARKFPLSLAQLQQLTYWVDMGMLCLVMAAWLRFGGTPVSHIPLMEALPWLALCALAPLAIHWAGGYRYAFVEPVAQHLQTVTLASAFMLAAIGLVTGLAFGEDIGRRFAALSLLSIAILAGLHGHYIALVKHLIRTGRLAQNVVIVGATPKAQRLIEENAVTRELNIVGIFDDRLARAPLTLAGAPLLGKLDDLITWQRLPEIDRIIVTVTSDARTRVRHLIDQLRRLPNQVVLLLDLDGFDPETQSLSEIAHSPAAYVSGEPEDARKAMVKRLTDIVLSTYMLLAVAPLIGLIAGFIRLRHGGPVFQREPRYGFNNQIFHVWAFHDGTLETGEAGQPQTHLARFLNRSGLCRIPQLLNVLLGDMSMVGPQALTTARGSKQTPHTLMADYAHRHRVKPGLTGWAQIHQVAEDKPQDEAFAEQAHRDMEYINRTSFWFDLYILMKTAARLIRTGP